MNTTRFVSILALVATAGALPAQNVVRAAASGRATSELALSTPQPGVQGMGPSVGVIRLDYGQPHLRGRAINTDSLVPFDRPWRLGANANTTLTTDIDLTVGGARLAKGSYVLYAIPGRSEWTLVVQRSIGQGATEYPDSATVARVPLRHVSLATPVESLTMWLIPSTEAGPARGELRFAWGTSQLSTTWAVR
jgi:hypothetical protein